MYCFSRVNPDSGELQKALTLVFRQQNDKLALVTIVGHKHTGQENQPGLGQKSLQSPQEEFQRIFGFSTNRTTTLKRLVCALEAPYPAQN